MDFDSSNELADSQYTCDQVVSLKNFFVSSQNVFNDALKSIQEYLQISKAASHTSSEPISETMTSLQGCVSSTNEVAMKLSSLQVMLHGYSLFTKGRCILHFPKYLTIIKITLRSSKDHSMSSQSILKC